MKIRNQFMVVPVLCALACGSGQPAQAPAASPAPAAPPAVSPASAGSAAPQAPTEPTASAAPAPAAVPAASAEPATPTKPQPSESGAPRKFLQVTLQAKSGSKLVGTATFSEKKDGVKITVELSGIKPGNHGVHVHENGDCSAADGSSAGGHFNPASNDHGLPDKEHRHLGDLGNIKIGQDGKGSYEILVAGANLADSDPNSFLGRSIVVHEKKDDGGQPTGNSGGRIGCGEIK